MRSLVFYLMPIGISRLDRLTHVAIRRFGFAPPAVVALCPRCALLYVALAHTADDEQLDAAAAVAAGRLASECPDHAGRFSIPPADLPAPTLVSPIPPRRS